MKRPYLGWYVLIAILALTPAGARMLAWRVTRSPEVDAAAAEAGQVLFTHVWKPKDPLSPGGDGLGPVFNANSCVACHHQGGPGGSGGIEHNVTTFAVRPEANGGIAREGVVHAFATNKQFKESLVQVDRTMPNVSQPSLTQLTASRNDGRHCERPAPRSVHFSQRNTPALFGAKLIDEIPERVIIANERSEQLRWGLATSKDENLPVGRALRLADRRIGRFGWKAQTASLAGFVQAACANELGLGNPGQREPRPLSKPDYEPCGLDLTAEQCDQLTAFVASLPRPVERLPDDPAASEQAREGKKLFGAIGCANCHTPDLGSVPGIYSDLLLHRMGQPLEGGGSYNEPPLPVPEFPSGEGPQPGEWRTPPLWGVADSAPYLHDGRADTLEQAIHFHGGQGTRSAERFKALSSAGQKQLVAFLQTLRAP